VVLIPCHRATQSPQNSCSNRTRTRYPESSATVQACDVGFGVTNNSRKNLTGKLQYVILIFSFENCTLRFALVIKYQETR
jgi:hypothetical protein